MSKRCVFCDIIYSDSSDIIVCRDSQQTAFLDKRPLFFGHVLLVPNQHIETFDALPQESILPYFLTAQRLATAIPKAVDAVGTFVAMNNRVSQSVAHLHLHIVPRNVKDGLRGFFWPRKKYESDSQMRQIAANIRDALEKVF
ncbi:MAG: HIT family protein [Chitinivibrionales bacterium]